MLKAHSLLYSVYICLIVSIICGAILYFATLYNQLNLYYNTHENLYIQNQSAVNYAIGNTFKEETVIHTDTSGVQSEIKTKPYGLLQLLVVKSFIKSDTITSAQFIGQNSTNKTALYISSISKSLDYSGNVKLIGDLQLPSPNIDEIYVSNSFNNLITTGTISISQGVLPTINANYKNIVEKPFSHLQNINTVTRFNDSIYYNSFLNKTIEIELSSPVLDNIIIKGNFVLYAKDSIVVKKNAVLEDIILKSPSIRFDKNFTGNIQAFSTKKITVDQSVTLTYPSVLCLYNNSNEKSEIKIDINSKLYGALVLFGNDITQIDKNEVIINKGCFVLGDIYCSGKLMLEGTIYGSVYTNRIFHKSNSSIFENCIANAEIDTTKKPSYFISIPLIENNKKTYGIYKKVN